MRGNQDPDVLSRSAVSALSNVSQSPSPLFLDIPEQQTISLRLLFRIVCNRRWLILAVVLAAMTATAIATLKQKPVYRAVGTIEIEMPKSTYTRVQDFFPVANVPENYLQTQSKIVSSGQLAGSVMSQLGLDNRPDFASSGSRWARNRSFQERLKVELVKGSRLIQVAFELEDPVLAANVVNRLMSLYIEQIQANWSETASGASGWLLNQLQESGAALDASRETLRRFERENKLLSVNPDRERLMNIDSERLQQLQQELTRVESSRIEKESIHRLVQAGETHLLQDILLEESLSKEAGLSRQLAELSAKFGPNFPRIQRLQADLAEARKISRAERERLARKAEAEYRSAAEQEALIRDSVERQRKKVEGGSEELMEYSLLSRQVELDQQVYEGFLQKSQEASTATNLRTVNARIVDRAEPPARSTHPGLLRNLMLGLPMGLIVGVGIALAQDFLRETFKSAAEIESYLEFPLLATVPMVKKFDLSASPNGTRKCWRLPGGARRDVKPGMGQWFRLDRDGCNHNELSEAIRNLRTSLVFGLEERTHQAILFTSSIPSEGKTTISSNVSIALAQLGKRVLMIDGDLRRPNLHRIFPVPNHSGLSDVLQGHCRWTDAMQLSDVPGLDILACGSIPANPTELLSGHRMRRIIEEAKTQYDVVIIDSPTLLNMADSRILAACADHVVLVVSSRATPKTLVKQACAALRGINTAILGVVLNQSEVRHSEYANYAYPVPDRHGDAPVAGGPGVGEEQAQSIGA